MWKGSKLTELERTVPMSITLGWGSLVGRNIAPEPEVRVGLAPRGLRVCLAG